MAEQPCVEGTHKVRKWYNNYTFPLIPVYEFKKGNKYNTNGFTFHWLFIKIWSLDAFQFELAIVVDTHWGIGITALLPYLRIVFCIPCPVKLQILVQRNLWRKPNSETEP